MCYINNSWDIFLRGDFNDSSITDEDTHSWIGAVWNPTKGLYISPNIYRSGDTEDFNNNSIYTYRLTCMFKY